MGKKTHNDKDFVRYETRKTRYDIHKTAVVKGGKRTGDYVWEVWAIRPGRANKLVRKSRTKSSALKYVRG